MTHQALPHVYWLGGAADSGKTSIAQLLAETHGLQVYHYDRQDARQVERLAEVSTAHRAFLAASLDERWVKPEPQALLEFALQSFRRRFPLVLEDLYALPCWPVIIAEGYGLTPELVAPLLLDPRQGAWLTPTPAFKWESMRRRGKPSFRDATSDPERATRNIYERDILIGETVKAQARALGLCVYEVDGTLSLAEMAARVERHFGLAPE